MNNFTRFVIHGHDLTSAIAQLYVTLGSTPTILFPCVSGYSNGLLSPLGISLSDQVWIQVALIAVSVSFSFLLTINRAFAINTWMKKHKKPILIIFFAQLIAQVIYMYFAGMNLKDGGEEARRTCLEKLPYEYPKVMYSSRGMDLSFQDTGMAMLCSYTLLYTVIYLLIGVVCCSILVQSITEQAKSSQSTQFLANQRRITYGILYFMIIEIVGFGCPLVSISSCIFLKVGNSVVSDFAFIFISSYPIFGPYYVLMSNMDYRNRVRNLLKKEAPITQCGINEVYNECGSMCEPQCNMILGVVVRPEGCIAVCRAGCECAAGHVRLNGVCLPETICRRYF